MRRLLATLLFLSTTTPAWTADPVVNGRYDLEAIAPQDVPKEPRFGDLVRTVKLRLVDRPRLTVASLVLGPTAKPLRSVGWLKQKTSERIANERMEQLLRESVELQQARQEANRMWLNNQPQVLPYKRIVNGVEAP